MAVVRDLPKQRSRTQAERAALSEKRILSAAVKLIARQGFSRTTLSEIGKEAGYTGGLVSHRFGSKKRLLRVLVDRITDRFSRDQLNELTARTERLRTLYVLMGEALGPVPELRDVFATLNDSFREAAADSIRRGIAVGDIRADVDPDAGAAMFLALLRGVSMQWLVDPAALDLDSLRESVKQTIRNSLAR
jgi:AcrR family transcriptional regulator